MKLAIDVREACTPKRTGKGQWTYGFVSELLTRNCEVLLLTDTDIPDEWKKHSPVIRCLSSGLRWHWQVASLLKKRTEIDLYITPTSYIVPFLLGSSCPFIPVVHDLIAFQGEPHDRKAKLIERLTLKRTLRHARHVCTVSESTKHDMLDSYKCLQPADISVLYAGPMESSPPQNAPDHKTILCAATLSPRKNQLRLIQAYKSLSSDLRSQYRLQLIGGRGWHDQEIVDLAKATEGVEWHDYVPSDQYNALLSTAHILALPSLYEGFGMQILDALQRGIPVLTSNRGSLKEVTEECAVLVDPESVESISEGLERILTSKALQQDLRTSGPQQAEQFSWKRTTDLFLASVKQLQ